MQAQVTLLVHGTVRDSLTQIPLTNKPVNINVPNDSIFVPTSTDQSGFFQILLTNVTPFGQLIVSIPNCDNQNKTFVSIVPQVSDTLSGIYEVCDSSLYCQIEFSYQANGPEVQFISEPILGANPTSSFFWQFGDNQNSFEPEPFHTYSSGGLYQVCLTYSDSFSCNSNTCKSLFINYDSSAISIKGNVSLNAPSIGSINARLLLEDSNNLFSTIQELTTRNGNYAFYNLDPGSYLVQGFIDTVSSESPTYWPNGFYWDEGATIILSEDLENLNFTLVQTGTLQWGSGKIFGTIKDEDGNDLVNTTVGLENSSGDIQKFIVTNEFGGYEFSTLPYGDYWLGADIPGIPTLKKFIQLSAQNPENEANFSINGGWLISGISSDPIYSIYPNPFESKLTVEGVHEPPTGISIYNSLGKKINAHWVYENNRLIMIFPKDHPDGIYYIKIEGIYETRLLKIIKS